MLVRKVLRRASRGGELVGWKVGRGPGGKERLLVRCWVRGVGLRGSTVFSALWGGGEGAALGGEAVETGAAVVG